MSQLLNLCNQKKILKLFFLLFITVILRLLIVYKKLLKKNVLEEISFSDLKT